MGCLLSYCKDEEEEMLSQPPTSKYALFFMWRMV